MKKLEWAVFFVLFLCTSLFVVFQNYSMKQRASVIQRNMALGVDTTGTLILKNQYKNLPEPVKRYLRYALGDKKRLDVFAQYKQAGWIQNSMNVTYYDHPNWKYIVADCRVRLDRPSFFWQALIHLGWEFWMKGWYRFDSSDSELYWTWMGAVQIALYSGPEMQKNAMGQFLIQLPWIPTAMFSSDYLEWIAVDDTSAQVKISIYGNQASGFFSFDSSGKIIRFITDDMQRMTDSGPRSESRMVIYDKYEQFMGVQVPSRLYFFWSTPAGWKSDADFRLDEIVYH